MIRESFMELAMTIAIVAGAVISCAQDQPAAKNTNPKTDQADVNVDEAKRNAVLSEPRSGDATAVSDKAAVVHDGVDVTIPQDIMANLSLQAGNGSTFVIRCEKVVDPKAAAAGKIRITEKDCHIDGSGH